MDIKTMDRLTNCLVKYNHRNDEPIYATLYGILSHKPNGKKTISAVLIDKSGSTYWADPRDIEEIEDVV